MWMTLARGFQVSSGKPKSEEGKTSVFRPRMGKLLDVQLENEIHFESHPTTFETSTLRMFPLIIRPRYSYSGEVMAKKIHGGERNRCEAARLCAGCWQTRSPSCLPGRIIGGEWRINGEHLDD
jgi:hypothetical protein